MLELVNRGKALLRRSPLLKNSFLIFSSSAIAGLFAYIYNIYMARILGPVDYGTVGALLSMYAIIAIPFSPISSAFTKFTADYNARGNPAKIAGLLAFGLHRALLIGSLLWLGLAISSRPIANFLKIPSPVPVALLGLLLLATILSTVMRGALRGLQDFRAVGLMSIGEAIARLAIGIPLVATFWVSGAVIGYGLATLLSVAFCAIPLWPFLRQSSEAIDTSGFLRFSGEVVIVALCYAVFGNLLVILTKRYASPEEAGFLVAVVTLGNLTIPLTDSFSTVMFPIVAEQHARAEQSLFTLTRTLSFVGFILLGTIVVFWALGGPIIALTYGDLYARAVPHLLTYAAIRALLDICRVYSNYCLASEHHRGTWALLAATLAQVLWFVLAHDSLTAILNAQLGGTLLALSILASERLTDMAFSKSHRRPTEEAQP
jgi:O-antigen/teichoic acid export membrane protein